MTDDDRQVAEAFDRLIERRQATTDVSAALVEVLDRQPWWRRFRLPIAIVITGAAAAALLLALFGSESARQAVETEPGLAGTTEAPVAVETTVVTGAEVTLETPATTLAGAIEVFLTARGDRYGADCATPTGPGLCWDVDIGRCPAYAAVGRDGRYGCSPVPVRLTETVPNPLDPTGDSFTTGDQTDETLLVASAGTEWFVVDAELDGHSIEYRAFQAGDADTIEWVTPAGTETVFTDATGGATVAPVFSDVVVGRDVSDRRCARSLVRIDSATGSVDDIGGGTQPMVDGTGRYLAYRGGDFEGREAGPGESCEVDGRLVVLDLHDGREQEVGYVNSGDLGGINTMRWAPTAPLIAVDDGPDSTRSSIVGFDRTGTLTKIELDRDIAEVNGLLSNEVVEWESDEVLVVRFYEFAGDAPDVLARYGTDGSFLSLVGESDSQATGPVVDLTDIDWATVLTTEPQLEVVTDQTVTGPPPAGSGPFVRIGSSAGWARVGEVSYVDLGGPDGSTEPEAVITLDAGGNGGTGGVLVFAAGTAGPTLVGPSSFYDDVPGAGMQVFTTRGTSPWLTLEEVFRPSWAPKAAVTGVHDRNYRLVDGQLVLDLDLGEMAFEGGLYELNAFFGRLIDGDVQGAAELLAPGADIDILGATDVAGAVAAVEPWAALSLQVDDGAEVTNQYGVTARLDGGGSGPAGMFGSELCEYDTTRHQCFITSVSVQLP